MRNMIENFYKGNNVEEDSEVKQLLLSLTGLMMAAARAAEVSRFTLRLCHMVPGGECEPSMMQGGLNTIENLLHNQISHSSPRSKLSSALQTAFLSLKPASSDWWSLSLRSSQMGYDSLRRYFRELQGMDGFFSCLSQKYLHSNTYSIKHV